ncbi:MAG: hypothetical protein KDA65_04670 [Planctomycetaceae bacterium]|nr:hypothetical protein [Planctomycetaceae bacterium]
MFRIGYIHNLRTDLVFFLLLPFWAIGFSLFAHNYLGAFALLSISVWITFPHHAATFVRTFGLKEDMAQYKERLIVGPIVIVGLAYLGMTWAPITYLALTQLWAYQHSIMQQHGFARIYDFKARTGMATTGKWDLGLNWVLFVNLIITAPLFVQFWVRELHMYDWRITAAQVTTVQMVSYALTGLYLLLYAVHQFKIVRSGNALNPLKYCFLGASYFLWYFLAWQIDNVFVFGIADRIMHGVQYIVIVYLYMDRKAQDAETEETYIKKFLSFGHVSAYLGLLLVYTLIYQLVRNEPYEQFGFGLNFLVFMEPYMQAIPEAGLGELSETNAMSFVFFMFVETIALIHYYYDSFIWKVSNKKTQKGL